MVYEVTREEAEENVAGDDCTGCGANVERACCHAMKITAAIARINSGTIEPELHVATAGEE